VIPHAAHPSAKASQSTVDAPQRHTGGGSSLGGTATSCASAPTSMPAACRLTAATWGGRAGWERRWSFLRWAIVAAIILGETDSGSGGGSGGVEGLFHTGSGHGLSPLVSPRAPGTNLINGHTAPLSLRPHTAHCLGVSRPQAASQFLPVARPRSGINTLIRVRHSALARTPGLPPSPSPCHGTALRIRFRFSGYLQRPAPGERASHTRTAAAPAASCGGARTPHFLSNFARGMLTRLT
jgi:hypothetical protein